MCNAHAIFYICQFIRAFCSLRLQMILQLNFFREKITILISLCLTKKNLLVSCKIKSFMVRFCTTISFKRFFGVLEFLVCANKEFMEKIRLARLQMFQGYYDKKASGEFLEFVIKSLAIQIFCKQIIFTTIPIVNILQDFVLDVVFPSEKFFSFSLCYQILIYVVNCLSMQFNSYRVRFITKLNNFNEPKQTNK